MTQLWLFCCFLRIQAPELLRANNPSEGKGQWSGAFGLNIDY